MPKARKRQSKSGRPRRDRYQERVAPILELISGWTRDGFTVDEICDRLRINRVTFYRYRKAHPELESALATGRDLADYRVENSLYKRAIGYDIPVVETTVSTKMTGIEKTVKSTARHIPGDVQAARIWLFNRRGKSWRDRQEVEHTTTGKITVVTKMAMPDPPPDGV